MWADAVEMARDRLLAELPARGLDVPIGAQVPNPRPPRFVRLMNSGSERRTIVHRDTRVTVEVWNEGGPAAAVADAEIVHEVLDEWPFVPTFDGWPSSPYEQPDPDTGIPRVVMTCIVRHRTDRTER